jgi:uncharacterized membrane protein
MQKILISAAIITGLIAPALYAAVSSLDTPKASQTATQTSSGKSLSMTSSSGSCVRSVMREYTEKKRELTKKNKAEVQLAMRKALTSVS